MWSGAARQGVRRDLHVGGGRAVAELRRPDGEAEPTLRVERDAGIAEVPARRDRVDHAQRRAAPDRPVAVRHGRAAAPRQRILDERQALVEPVGAVFDVALLRRGADHRVAGADDVQAPHRERVDAEPVRQLVDGRFHREDELAETVAAEGAGRHLVGVDRVAVDRLRRDVVDSDRLAAAVVQHAAGVVAVGAGVRHGAQRDGGEAPVAPRAELHPHRDGVARRRGGELLLARQLQLHGPARAQRRQRRDVLDQHLLLPAEPAADALAQHPHPVLGQAQQAGQRPAGQERHLRRGPHDQPPVVVGPGDGAMRLQMGRAGRAACGRWPHGPRRRRRSRPRRRRWRNGTPPRRCGTGRGCRSPRACRRGAAARRAPSRPRGRRRRAAPRSRPPAPGSRPRRRPRFRPPPSRRAGRGSA